MRLSSLQFASLLVTYLDDDIPGEHRAGTGHECGENGVRGKNIAIWVFSGKLGGKGRGGRSERGVKGRGKEK